MHDLQIFYPTLLVVFSFFFIVSCEKSEVLNFFLIKSFHFDEGQLICCFHCCLNCCLLQGTKICTYVFSKIFYCFSFFIEVLDLFLVNLLYSGKKCFKLILTHVDYPVVLALFIEKIIFPH